jgi:hypothetical protein
MGSSGQCQGQGLAKKVSKISKFRDFSQFVPEHSKYAKFLPIENMTVRLQVKVTSSFMGF